MVQRIAMAPQGPEFSRFVMGYWRLMDWHMSAQALAGFVEQHLDLGVTTIDHADIYGDYRCEATFGEALKLAPHLRSRMEIVSKCGIATKARAENTIGHYITDRDHIVLSAEQSLRNLATDHLDLLLIHRPDPLMDADEVAEAFLPSIIAARFVTSAYLTLPPPSLPCCSRACRLLWRPTRWKFLRSISRYCSMGRWISFSNCAFARWPGLASAAAVCLTTTAFSRYAMSWRAWLRS
jgi:hypothetical protein